eukprot:scaffold42458_cov68-Phaeocystis_antarctica.AAC.4
MLKATPHNQSTPHKDDNDGYDIRCLTIDLMVSIVRRVAMEPWLMRGDWGASAGVGTGAPLSR